LLDLASLAVTLVLIVVVAFDLRGPGRILLAVAFVTYVPGRAVLTMWSAARERSDIALPVILSIALLIMATVLTLWVHVWEPEALFFLIAVVSACALGAALLRRLRAAMSAPRATNAGRTG